MAILVNIGYVSRSTLGKGLEPKFQLNEIHLVKIGEEKAIISCRFDYFQCVEWEVVNGLQSASLPWGFENGDIYFFDLGNTTLGHPNCFP
jgi:hypothetical protein